MNASENLCIHIGRMTREPESRDVGDTTVTNFGLAVNKKFKKASGELVEKVNFFEYEAWGKSGEVITQYCKKGDPLYVRSEAETDEWQDKEGNKRSRVKFRVTEFKFLGSKNNASASDEDQQQPVAAGKAKRGKQTSKSDEEVPF